jgi:hypothetical protein
LAEFRNLGCNSLIVRQETFGTKPAIEFCREEDIQMEIERKGFSNDRRSKHRFEMRQELRYKVLQRDRIVATGVGQTLNISSRGVAVEAPGLKAGSLVELAINWPVLLDETCRMRLIIFGRVVRADKNVTACTIDKYEFRTQARSGQTTPIVPLNNTFRRWADATVREIKPLFARA